MSTPRAPSLVAVWHRNPSLQHLRQPTPFCLFQAVVQGPLQAASPTIIPHLKTSRGCRSKQARIHHNPSANKATTKRIIGASSNPKARHAPPVGDQPELSTLHECACMEEAQLHKNGNRLSRGSTSSRWDCCGSRGTAPMESPSGRRSGS